jgi:hypothetical protein
MSVNLQPGLNGRLKKSLAHQLDRLDTILDGLAEALHGAVADAVKQAVGQAAKEAVQVALAEAMKQEPKEKPVPAPRPNPLAGGQTPHAAGHASYQSMDAGCCWSGEKSCIYGHRSCRPGDSVLLDCRSQAFHQYCNSFGSSDVVCHGFVSQGCPKDLVGCRCDCFDHYAGKLPGNPGHLGSRRRGGLSGTPITEQSADRSPECPCHGLTTLSLA